MLALSFERRYLGLIKSYENSEETVFKARRSCVRLKCDFGAQNLMRARYIVSKDEKDGFEAKLASSQI